MTDEGQLAVQSEDGAVAVIVAVSLVVLFLIVGMAVDLGMARADVRANQSISDFAAIAGAQEVGNGYQAACRRAVEYVYANTPELTDVGTALGNCAVFGTLGTPDNPCTETTEPIPVLIVDAPYEIRIVAPVDNSDPAMGGQPENLAFDGDRCQRIKVEMRRERAYAFGPVGGIFAGNPVADAVARRTEVGDTEGFSSLIVLEREACEVLSISGQGGIRVNNHTEVDEDTGEITVYEGRISVDTLATPGAARCNNRRAIHQSPNSEHGFLRAEGEIRSFGMFSGRPADAIYNSANLGVTLADGEPKLTPTPTAGRIQTRAPVDHLFNCKDEYGDDPWEPWDDIPACEEFADTPAYVDQLVGALQSGALPAGFNVYPDDVHDVLCAAHDPGDDPDNPIPCPIPDDDRCRDFAGITIDGNLHGSHWYINCTSSGPDIFPPGAIEFTNMQVVVSQNRIDHGYNDQELLIEGHPDTGAILYVRNGFVNKGGQAILTIRNTFTYVHNGYFRAGAGANMVTVRAPIDDHIASNCDSYEAPGLPPAGCFVPLALWSNANTLHRIAGQAPLNVAGTFFTPNADPFDLSGQADQELHEAQFFSARIEVSGQGRITLRPNPGTNVPTPEFGTGLIR